QDVVISPSRKIEEMVITAPGRQLLTLCAVRQQEVNTPRMVHALRPLRVVELARQLERVQYGAAMLAAERDRDRAGMQVAIDQQCLFLRRLFPSCPCQTAGEIQRDRAATAPGFRRQKGE